jgi:anti-sigma factor RsiW
VNCEEFEILMADALGDELSPSDRPAFEAHLAACARCREEYESATETVVTMRSLPGPRRVAVKREGNRLVIEDARNAGLVGAGPRRSITGSWRVFRYAASVLIAFAGGYALHAGLMAADASRRAVQMTAAGPGDPVAPALTKSDSLQSAIVSAHVRNPARTDLAKCLVALAHTRR